MRLSSAAAAGMVAVAFCAAAAATRQDSGGGPVVRTIELTRPGPIEAAIQTLQLRYGLAITYESPRYVSPTDVEERTSPYTGRKYLVGRGGTTVFKYVEKDGMPEENIAALLRRLLDQRAAHGGAVFDVRERATRNGPEWNVIPLRARDESGSFVNQPGVLGTIVYVPRQERTVSEMVQAICDQLALDVGVPVKPGLLVAPMFLRQSSQLGAENVTARDALAGVLGLDSVPLVWFMKYDAESRAYYLNVVEVPHQPRRALIPRPVVPPRPGRPRPVPPAVWLRRSMRPAGLLEIQDALARAGFYRGPRNGNWDGNTAGAARAFQAAHGINQTGKVDFETLAKLEPFLPLELPHPQPWISPAVSYWLQNSPEGVARVQRALAQAGFYQGTPTQFWDPKTRDSLERFQVARGLQPTGTLDLETGRELAPLLQQPPL